MQDLLDIFLRYQRILILGFGREGQSTYLTIRNLLPDRLLFIADEKEILKTHPLLTNDNKIILNLGKTYLDDLPSYDLIMKSPGISLKHHQHLIGSLRISSQADIFLNLFHSQTIGVTGTKGKSTTSSLIYHILHKFTTDTVLVGNIGIPPFDVLDKITPKTVIVFELSSHQLQFINKAPHMSVLLNIFPEHLDYYSSYEEYQQSKFNIIRFQDDNDWVFYNTDNTIIKQYLDQYNKPRNMIALSIAQPIRNGFQIVNNKIFTIENGQYSLFYDNARPRSLMGEHNLFNMMVATAVCRVLSIPDTIVQESFLDFKSLPHRLEFIGTFNNIHFYNDSISTIPETTIAALKAIPDVDTLILGGFNRGIDYSCLIEFVSQHSIENLICIGSAGKAFYDAFNEHFPHGKHTYLVETYDEIIDLSFKITKSGKACLLSPAAASYDMFKNFEDRGVPGRK